MLTDVGVDGRMLTDVLAKQEAEGVLDSDAFTKEVELEKRKFGKSVSGIPQSPCSHARCPLGHEK